MSLAHLVLLALAAVVASAINSVAGGGSLVTWPAAVALGLSKVTASATNTVALTPGVLASALAYRRELRDNLRLALWLSVPAGFGGLAGATLLLAAPARVFDAVVPWLILGATLAIVLKDVLFRKAEAARGTSKGRRVAVGAALALIAVYGGYFGAGIGIVTLALLALLHRMNIHQMNAMKTVIVGIVNGVAAVFFLFRGAADLPAAGAMLAGSVIGGFGGASLARRVNPEIVRWAVVALGLALAGYLAVQRWS
jgi:uncharacterized protein